MPDGQPIANRSKLSKYKIGLFETASQVHCTRMPYHGLSGEEIKMSLRFDIFTNCAHEGGGDKGRVNPSFSFKPIPHLVCLPAKDRCILRQSNLHHPQHLADA